MQQYTNHIALVIDSSGSMQGKPVATVVDKELNHLRKRSVELGQETRVSIYLFNENVRNLVFDMDVMRFESIAGFWNPDGGTALIDATKDAITDHQKVPTMYGDHAFLLYVITDGEENRSRSSAMMLSAFINQLADNWTIACLVPDSRGVSEAKRFGFPKDSIAIWDTKSKLGFEDVGKQFSNVMENYMQMRSSGVRSTKSLFTLDSSGVKKAALKLLSPSRYTLIHVRKDGPIKETVEYWTKSPYVLGSSYYMPTKPVVIQDYKNVLVQDRKTGKIYEGADLRDALGLPPATVKVNPGEHKEFNIFVQSTSTNRKVFKDTFVVVR